MKKIGILTGGADCPGLNSVIRAVVRKSMQVGYVVTGIKNGWMGLVTNDTKVLDVRLTSGILDRGGTILGTSRMVSPLEGDIKNKIIDNFKRSGMDAVIAVGGQDTLKIALDLYKEGNIPVVGVPKTIDNALTGTDYAFGFDTAVNIATTCIDRLHTTAESHHRIVIIEVMGRYTGWIALDAGIAGGADFILVPEYPIEAEESCAALKSRHKRGQNYSVIVVAEGARIKGIDMPDIVVKGRRNRSINIGEVLSDIVEEKTGYEARVSNLGHILRGGTPTAFDRIIATRFGVKAVELVCQKDFGKMASLHENKMGSVDIELAVSKHKTIDKDLYEMTKIFST